MDISTDYTFGGISSDATLYVPKGTLALYQSTAPWKSNFKYIVEFDSDETAIDTPIHRGIAVIATAGSLTISGLNDGESISIYSIVGSLLSKSTAVAGTAIYNGTSGDIVIVKIGEQSIKVQL